MLKLFVLIAVVCVPVASKCSSKNIKSEIDLIGEPVEDIVINWQTVNPHPSSALYKVHYKVYYNKTSHVNRCNCEAMKFMYNAVHCNQQSSIPSHMLHCTLKAKEIAKSHVNFEHMESICIVVEAVSTNATWYSFNECRSPESENTNCVSICPVPENVQVTAVTDGSLTVKWDAPSNLATKALQQDISFTIYYRRRAESLEIANTSFTEIILNSQPNRKFTAKNNIYIIEGLEPFTSYDVKICCSFQFYQTACQFSSVYVVRTLEEEPSNAPIITGYGMNARKPLLLIKWKTPDMVTWNGHIVRFEVNVWNNNNCTAVNTMSLIQKNVTTNGTRISGHEFQFTISLHETSVYCGRVRMCTVPGCGPWSRVYSTQKSISNRGVRESSQGGKVLQTVLFSAITGTIIIALVIVIFVSFSRRNGRQRQPLSERVDDVNPSITSSTDTESDRENEYATPNAPPAVDTVLITS